MGAPDQTIDKDAHASLVDDGRRLTPVDIDSYSGAGQGHNDEAYDTTLVLRFFNDGRLVPDTLHVHTHGFTVTKWEAKYSSIWSDANWRDTPWRTQKLVPVIDASYCVIGHAGWIRAPSLCVPTETVSYDPSKVDRNMFWELLEELRLKRALGQAPSREAARHFSLAVEGHASAADQPVLMSAAPQNWESNGERYRKNVNYFLSGGGKAVVGDGPEDNSEIFESGDYAEYVSDYETVAGVIRHRNDCYMFLVLVDPRGYVQAVLAAEIVPPPTFGEKALEFALGLIDVTLAILLVVDIVTIPVALLRAGLVVARAAAIRAVELVADKFTQTVERMAVRDVQELLKMARLGRYPAEELAALGRGTRGAMSGPEQAEARTAWQKLRNRFWDAGKTPPQKLLTMSKDQVEAWNKKIAKRMRELGIPENNIGVKKRVYDPVSGELQSERPMIAAKENGEALNTSNYDRGGNMRSFRSADEVEELGISVHGNVFDDWQGFELWNQSSVEDRIDAIIAHEWSEFNELTHWETVEMAPETKLPVTERAREMLRYMKIMGKPEMAITEFTKAEWEAIVKAGKATASFEEKMKIAARIAAQGK